jgi:hypothetical protein
VKFYEHLDGEYDREEMVRLPKEILTIRQKRQNVTWFKKNQDEFHWFGCQNEARLLICK